MADNLDEILRRAADTKVPRRSFLAAAGLLGGSAALAACSTGTARRQRLGGCGERRRARSLGAAAGESASAPPAGPTSRSELFMYNWSDYIAPKNIDAVQGRSSGSRSSSTTRSRTTRSSWRSSRRARQATTSPAPTAEYVPSMVEGGYIPKLDLVRIPNQKYIDPAFMGLVWDPNDEYQLPKDFGTTGVLYRTRS